MPSPAPDKPPRRRRLPWLWGLVGVLAIGASSLGLLTAALLGFPGRRARPSSRTPSAPVLPRTAELPQAVLTLAPRGRPRQVPPAFLGVSTEYWTLPFWERQLPELERVLALLHVPGDAPLVLRIGGDSADHSFWMPTRHAGPEWAFELTPAWLARTRTLLEQTRTRVILDLNLITATPRIAALWAAAARTGLPAHRIIAFEIGNEPDIYSRGDWLSILKGDVDARRDVPITLSVQRYVRDFAAYRAAIARMAPDTPVLGPALGNPVVHRDWIARLLGHPHPGLAAVTAHRYPYSECAFPGTPAYATVRRVLSEAASAGLARGIEPDVAMAHRAGLPFRLTELNSVTCGGRPGVSDTFATALWAPDALLELLRAGVDAVNVHVREYAINAAFVLTHRGLRAHPLLYGLIMFTRMLGPHAQLVPLTLHARASLHLKAWAVRLRGGVLHVLVIDKGASTARVWLRLPARGPAYVQRLLAPAAHARQGVTLDGQSLDVTGAWRGSATREILSAGPNGYALTVPRLSAAMVTLHLSGRGPGRAEWPVHERPASRVAAQPTPRERRRRARAGGHRGAAARALRTR